MSQAMSNGKGGTVLLEASGGPGTSVTQASIVVSYGAKTDVIKWEEGLTLGDVAAKLGVPDGASVTGLTFKDGGTTRIVGRKTVVPSGVTELEVIRPADPKG